MSREEIEQRRAERAAKLAGEREEQEEKDLEAIDALESANAEVLHTMNVGTYAAGLPAIIAYRGPSAEQYKRFTQQIRAAGDNKQARGQAFDLLGESCWVYPVDPETRKTMKTGVHAGVIASISVAVVKLAEAQTEVEGKG